MNKTQLLERLLWTQSNFGFGLNAWAQLRAMRKGDFKKARRAIIKEDGIYSYPPDRAVRDEDVYVITLGGSPDFNIKNASNHFALMILRSFTLEMFEAIKSYCDETNQMHLLRKQSWHQFARVVRNSFGHDYHWRFRSHDFKLLPIRWGRRKIDASLADQDLKGDDYDWWDAMELWQEIHDFAQTLR